jgi:antitoxin component YwqK of YwqJK toxin-antitoxin module
MLRLLFVISIFSTLYGQTKSTDTVLYGNGKIKQVCNYNANSKIWNCIYYHETGFPNSIFQYDSTKSSRIGRVTHFDLEGELVALYELDKDGLFEGYFIEYYLNGNLKQKGKFQKSVRIGEWIEFYPNGKIKTKKYYKYKEIDFTSLEKNKDRYHNIEITYCKRDNEEAQKIILEKYGIYNIFNLSCGQILTAFDGLKVGNWLYYDENGKKIKCEKFK